MRNAWLVFVFFLVFCLIGCGGDKNIDLLALSQKNIASSSAMASVDPATSEALKKTKQKYGQYFLEPDYNYEKDFNSLPTSRPSTYPSGLYGFYGTPTMASTPVAIYSEPIIPEVIATPSGGIDPATSDEPFNMTSAYPKPASSSLSKKVDRLFTDFSAVNTYLEQFNIVAPDNYYNDSHIDLIEYHPENKKIFLLTGGGVTNTSTNSDRPIANGDDVATYFVIDKNKTIEPQKTNLGAPLYDYKVRKNAFERFIINQFPLTEMIVVTRLADDSKDKIIDVACNSNDCYLLMQSQGIRLYTFNKDQIDTITKYDLNEISNDFIEYADTSEYEYRPGRYFKKDGDKIYLLLNLSSSITHTAYNTQAILFQLINKRYKAKAFIDRTKVGISGQILEKFPDLSESIISEASEVVKSVFSSMDIVLGSVSDNKFYSLGDTVKEIDIPTYYGDYVVTQGGYFFIIKGNELWTEINGTAQKYCSFTEQILDAIYADDKKALYILTSIGFYRLLIDKYNLIYISQGPQRIKG